MEKHSILSCVVRDIGLNAVFFYLRKKNGNVLITLYMI